MAHRTTWLSSVTPAGSIDVVTSTTAADTLVAFTVSDDSTDPFVITWPSGFVEQGHSRTTVDAMNVACAIKVNATGAEGTLAISTSVGAIIAGVSAYSGRNTVTQPDVTSVTVTEDAFEDPPTTTGTIVPTTDGCDIVGIYGVDTFPTPVSTTTFSGGGLTWNTRANHIDTGAADFRNISIGDAPQPTAASINVLATGTQRAAKVLFVLAIKPAAADGPSAGTDTATAGLSESLNTVSVTLSIQESG